MLDPKLLRESPDLVRAAIAKKHLQVDLDEVLALDAAWRSQLAEVEALRAKQKAANTEMVKLPKGSPEFVAKVQEMKAVSAEVKARETGLGEIELGAFRMTSSRLPGANLSFLAELGFWQSGTIESVLTGWHRDAFSIDVPGGTERVADAMRRGRECTRDFYIDCDFFEFKDKTVDEIRTAWNILPKGVPDSPGWRFG